MTTTGEELLAELAAADAAIAEAWTDWDTMLYANKPGGIPKADRDAWYARLTQVHAAREAVAEATWAHFEGPGATAAERAAWTLMDPRWQHGADRR